MLRNIPKVKRYDVFELVYAGKTEGNPFIDYDIKAVFKGESEEVEVNGFYDGFGNYVVRFMPSFMGEYEYSVSGSFSDETHSGTFKVIAADKNNHGPVRVSDTYHFAYDDGTPYYSVGTTCYVWELRDDKLIAETLSGS